MKFLIFNIATIGALYYLFTNDVNGTDAVAGNVQQTINRFEKVASSIVSEAREQIPIKEAIQTQPTPKHEKELEIPPGLQEEVVAQLNLAMVEPVIENTISDEPVDDTPTKSTAERRKELLAMAKNMELYYLKKAVE
jgi:hypothetical protein